MRDFGQNWTLGRRENGLGRYSRNGSIPSIVADFANGIFGLGTRRVSFDEVASLARNSSGGVFARDGQLQFSGQDAPRFDHDPASGQSLGLLIEEQRENLLLHSQDASQTGMSPPNAFTVQLNAETAPDGSSTADLVAPSSTFGPHINYGVFSGSADTQYCHSLFIKPTGAYSYARLNLGSSGFPPSGWATFDLAGAAVHSSGADVDNAGIEECADGWFRIWVTVTSDSDGGGYIAGIYAMDAAANVSFAGDGATGYLVWGRQVEAGAGPSSYVPSSAGAGNRLAESCMVEGGALTENLNASEGTLLAEFTMPFLPADNVYPLDLGDGTGDNALRFSVSPSGQVTFIMAAGGVTQAAVAGGSCQPGSLCRVAAAYSAEGVSVSMNGALPTEAGPVSLPSGIQRMAIGHAEAVPSNHLNGAVGRILYFGDRLTNADIQALSV